MTIGMRDINRIRSVEAELASMGMRIGWPQHGGGEGRIAVNIVGDNKPVWANGQEVFVGSLDEVDAWLTGWQKCELYMKLLGFEEKVARAEALMRQENLVRTLQSDPNEDVGD